MFPSAVHKRTLNLPAVALISIFKPRLICLFTKLPVLEVTKIAIGIMSLQGEADVHGTQLLERPVASAVLDETSGFYASGLKPVERDGQRRPGRFVKDSSAPVLAAQHEAYPPH